MTKIKYLNLCMTMPSEWLRQCANEPSPYMRPIHIAIILVALRKKARRS